MSTKTIWIGNRPVGKGHPCFIIAEAGVNHNGDVQLAHRLIEVAAQHNADAVKFQKRSVGDILIEEVFRRPYSSPNALASTYGEHREKLELSEKDFLSLSEHSSKLGVMFLASAWDPKSADLLEKLDVPAFKIASADLTNLPLLDHIARKGRPMIVSTGMSTLEEVGEAVEVIRRHAEKFILLHCVSTYPCDNDKINLKVMETLRREFDCLVGYSGHERGIAISVAAATMGACVVERHFTLDRAMPGPDHAASLEPEGLRRLIHYIRTVEAAQGTPEKRLYPEEVPIRERLSKSIVAARGIPEGAVITAEMLTVKGPGTGLAPKHLSKLVGKVARVSVDADTLLPEEALGW